MIVSGEWPARGMHGFVGKVLIAEDTSTMFNNIYNFVTLPNWYLDKAALLLKSRHSKCHLFNTSMTLGLNLLPQKCMIFENTNFVTKQC